MQDIIKSVDEILKQDVIERHSFFQLQHFVLDMEPTTQGKLHACLRELKTRRISLETMQLEAQDIQDKQLLLLHEMEDLKAESGSCYEGADLERWEKEHNVAIRSVQRKLIANERNYREMQRKLKFMGDECLFFVTAFNQLLEEEELKPWDDVEVQKEYWDAKITDLLKTKLIFGLPLDQDLVKSALCLHDDAQAKKITQNLIQQQLKFNDTHGLPMPDLIKEEGGCSNQTYIATSTR